MVLLGWGPKKPGVDEETFYQETITDTYAGPDNALYQRVIDTHSSTNEGGPFSTLTRRETIVNDTFRCDNLITQRTTTVIDYDVVIEMYAIWGKAAKLAGQTYQVPEDGTNAGQTYWDSTTKDITTIITETWQETKRNKWIYTKSISTEEWVYVKAGGTHAIHAPDENGKTKTYAPSFKWVKRFVFDQETGDQAGPAPEFKPSPWDFESQERESESVRAPGLLGTRVRRVALPYPTGATRDIGSFNPCGLASDLAADCDDHLDAWAALWDKLINNQSRSRQFLVPYTDTIRTHYRPFQVFTAEHLGSDGLVKTARYFINGFSLQLSGDECLCLIDAVWLADV